MKLLIADSGSTKTQWTFCTDVAGEKPLEFLTQGLNPFHCSQDVIETVARTVKVQPDVVCFYGAGCIGSRCQVVESALQQVFVQAEIRVESDMLGACRALCGEQSGVACILGTGSNSCLYDGTTMIDNVPSLGFILGDEGSGSVLGRQLVSDVLKLQLPADLLADFESDYGVLVSGEVIERVYRQPLPNRYLASFVPFLSRHIEHPYCRSLVEQSFDQFLRRNVMHYRPAFMALHPEAAFLPIGFVGSVACHFRPQLESVVGRLGMQITSVLQTPMPGLIAYHTAAGRF